MSMFGHWACSKCKFKWMGSMAELDDVLDITGEKHREIIDGNCPKCGDRKSYHVYVPEDGVAA